jgi:hypothetical protein
MSPTPQHYAGELILELKGFTDGQGTWIALRPDSYEPWDGRNLYRSGVWTTPRFPSNPSVRTYDDNMKMRNIMTIANRYVVAAL